MPKRVSVTGISDQAPPRPEQQHQKNAERPQHGPGRLIQHDLDDVGPESGNVGFHPDAQRLLTGLVNVVPELGKTRLPQ